MPSLYVNSMIVEEEICEFLANDMRGCFKSAIESAVYNKARNDASLKRIAHDASININQILQRAKEEFAEGGAPQVMEKVTEFEELYSADEVLEELRSHLGLRFVAAFRVKLTEEILEATSEFQHKGGEIDERAEQLLKTLEAWFKTALKQVEGKFLDPEIHDLVIADIKELKKLYLDPDSLKKKFMDYIQ